MSNTPEKVSISFLKAKTQDTENARTFGKDSSRRTGRIKNESTTPKKDTPAMIQINK
jgi:hypothetical protein